MLPGGLQKGAGSLSFTLVCIPKGMHRCPRVRDNHMAASFYKKPICRDENLFIVRLKTKLGRMFWGHIVMRGRSQ